MLETLKQLEARAKLLKTQIALLNRSVTQLKKETALLARLPNISPSECRCGGTFLVIDSRKKQDYIRRRRKCDRCKRRITTMEVVMHYDTSDDRRVLRQVPQLDTRPGE